MIPRLAALAFVSCMTIGAAVQGATGTDPVPRGLGLLRVGEFEAAAALLEEGLRSSPDDPDALLALAEIYLGWSDWQRARPLAERVVALATDTPRAAGEIELPVDRSGGDVAASAGSRDTRLSKAHLRIAQCLALEAFKGSRLSAWLRTGDIADEMRKAVTADPANSEARLALVRLYLALPRFGSVDSREALDHAREAAAIYPVEGLAALAEIELATGDDGAATTTLDRLRALDPGRATLARAAHFERKGRDEAAVSEVLSLPSADPADARDLTSGAEVLIRLGRYAGALTLLDRARRVDPSWLLAAYRSGEARVLARRDLEEAIVELREYLLRESRPQQPSHASAHWLIGRAQEALGRPAEARLEYLRAVSMEPGNRDFERSLDDFGGAAR